MDISQANDENWHFRKLTNILTTLSLINESIFSDRLKLLSLFTLSTHPWSEKNKKTF